MLSYLETLSPNRSSSTTAKKETSNPITRTAGLLRKTYMVAYTAPRDQQVAHHQEHHGCRRPGSFPSPFASASLNQERTVISDSPAPTRNPTASRHPRSPNATAMPITPSTIAMRVMLWNRKFDHFGLEPMSRISCPINCTKPPRIPRIKNTIFR